MNEVEYTDSVKVTGGLIRGYKGRSGVRIFKGIPYAKAPEGKDRFKWAKEPEGWMGVKDCLKFGPSPIQAPLDHTFDRLWTKEFIITNTDCSEDCLSLNIWAPAEDSSLTNSKYPVILYFFGGGFVTGGSSCEIYDGSALAENKVIYISFNHRVGNLSLFMNEEIDEFIGEKSGNCNLKDAITALKWIRENIGSFGGDKDNITIWGQSAGAAEVMALCASPLAKGLFKRCITMGYNNFVKFARPWFSQKEAIEASNKLLKDKNMKTEDLFTASYEFYAEDPKLMNLIVDGMIVTDYCDVFVKRGDTSDVDMIMGAVTGDVLMGGVFRRDNPDSREKVLEYLKAFFGDDLGRILEIYDFENKDLAAFKKDINYDNLIISQLYFKKERYKAGAKSTHIYFFTHPMPGPDEAIFGAFHSAEVPYFMDYYSDFRKDYWKEKDFLLGKTLCRFLSSYVTDGDVTIMADDEGEGYSYTLISTDEISVKYIDKEKYDLWVRGYERL